MKSIHFSPPRRRGLIIHVVILLGLSAVSATGFIFLSRASAGTNFLVALVVALLAFIPIPFFIYRGYTLQRADYILDRDSLSIQWGLRVEDIPLTEIEWMRLATDLTHPLKYPLLSRTGEILGIRRHPDLGLVEYLASDSSKLILIATSNRVYAISPDDPGALLQAFAHATELGSLSPAEARSIKPSFLIGQAWQDGLIRFLWLSGIFLNLGSFIWVSILIPAITSIALGSQNNQSEVTGMPATQLILLPVVSLVLLTAGWLAGLSLYRWKRERPLAYLVWSSGSIMCLLFLLAILFVVTTPV